MCVENVPRSIAETENHTVPEDNTKKRQLRLALRSRIS